jgi:hypothetical protein
MVPAADAYTVSTQLCMKPQRRQTPLQWPSSRHGPPHIAQAGSLSLAGGNVSGARPALAAAPWPAAPS